VIAGFDPSLTHTGWVVFDENRIGKESVLEAGVFRTETSDGTIVQRLIMQRERVRLLLEAKNVRFVTMEAPIMQEWSTEILFALHYYYHEIFLELGVFVVLIHSSSWKSICFPGKDINEITKAHSSHLAKVELGRQGKRLSEHVADAYHLGKIGHRFYQWYIMHLFKDDGLTEAEQNLFCGKHTFQRGEKKGMTEYTGIIYRENEMFFDYSKYRSRNKEALVKELLSGAKEGQEFDNGRIL